jgi:presenilin 1
LNFETYLASSLIRKNYLSPFWPNNGQIITAQKKQQSTTAASATALQNMANSNMAQHPQAYGATAGLIEQPTSHYQLQDDQPGDSTTGGLFRDDDEDEDLQMSLTELLYSSSSYHAIAKPVSITMILSALAVVLINNEYTLEAGEEAMREAYTVFNTDGTSDSTGKTLALSLGNAFIMVSVLCLMTFVIVLLYKLRCMKILIGYMILASATLLGVLGGNVFEVAIIIYQLPVDILSFYLIMYNFAIVGVMAVFWGRGVSPSVTQGYLIATSVILAWQLAHFDTWTAWALLVMLALYDLCAVLTPCGPLKALVNLMQRDDAPSMPGLLYEAELPPEAHRPGVPQRRQRSDLEATPVHDPDPVPDVIADDRSSVVESVGPEEEELDEGEILTDITADIPLAIARVYNLPIVGVNSLMTASSSRLLDGIPEDPTPRQLRSIVTVRLPAQGGRLEPVGRNNKIFLERDRFGKPKRTLWVDRHGKVFAEACDDEDDIESGTNKNSIRLGLGDFIFYSVLVAKAAQYSFATFAACMLVILAGLGGTLILLAVFHHALPALPISIALGVVFYVLTLVWIEPWIEVIMKTPYYV